MRVSVAIAAYNGERYIREQLESILGQTVLPDEIVISDDCSTDGTVSVIKNIMKESEDIPVRFKLLENGRNLGVTANFENALRHTGGDLVFLCDQDDIWLPNKVEYMTALMAERDENMAFHNAGILMQQEDQSFRLTEEKLSDTQNKDIFQTEGTDQTEGGSGTAYKVKKLDREDFLWRMFDECMIHGMCIVVRQEYLRSILPISVGFYHDHWLLFCAAADDTLVSVSEVLAQYRIHNNNTSGIGKYRRRTTADRIKAFDRHGKESIRSQYIWNNDAKEYLNSRGIRNGNIEKSWSYFGRERAEILSDNRISALIQLAKKNRQGYYISVGRVMYYHDVWFVLRYGRKYRRDYIRKLDRYLRT